VSKTLILFNCDDHDGRFATPGYPLRIACERSVDNRAESILGIL
jgi:hypothetical protein